MAIPSEQHTSFIPDFEAASERAVEAGERFLEAGRKATTAYLDGVEKYIGTVTSYERKLSIQSEFGPVSDVLKAHAELTEELTGAGLRAAREVITK